jgi:hypothetical protein
MENAGHPAAGVAGEPSEVESKLLRGLVDYLRQKRPELRQEWASRLTDAQLLRVMRDDEIFSEVTAVYDNYVNALETESVEALRAYARDLSERIVRRGVETDEVLGTVLLLRDVLARALFLRHQGDPELLGRVLDVYEPAANRIAVIVGVSFVEERERVIREQQAAIRERAEMLHRLSTFLADASLALDVPGSLEEILQLVAEHTRELFAAARCRAEIHDGTTIDAHAEAAPGTEPVAVAPTEVAALYAAVAPGRRSLRMSSAELAAEPARRTLEGAGHRVRSMRSWLVASLCATDGNEVGLIQAFDKREGEFTHLDEEVLVQLAQMAAAAVNEHNTTRTGHIRSRLSHRSRCPRSLPVGLDHPRPHLKRDQHTRRSSASNPPGFHIAQTSERLHGVEVTADPDDEEEHRPRLLLRDETSGL